MAAGSAGHSRRPCPQQHFAVPAGVSSQLGVPQTTSIGSFRHEGATALLRAPSACLSALTPSPRSSSCSCLLVPATLFFWWLPGAHRLQALITTAVQYKLITAGSATIHQPATSQPSQHSWRFWDEVISMNLSLVVPPGGWPTSWEIWF